MAKYGSFLYRGGYYGEIPRLPFSVEPFQAVAVDYDKVVLSWGAPQGAVNGLRIVRNQTGYGEWPEDGIVLVDRNSDEGDFGDGFYIDGQDNLLDDDENNEIPLVPGRFVYYRVWLRRSETNLWVPAEDVVVVLPSRHGSQSPDGEVFIDTHDAVMDLLPRVYTSASQSPLDPVDTTSDLYTFLKSFSFSIDEFLTFADLLAPDFSGLTTNPALLDLQAGELGLQVEDREFVIRQKKMVREAIYMYSRKGTPLAIGTLIESLTGFAPTITQTPNLFLSNQDSTFNNSLGNWRVLGDGTLDLTAELRPPSGEEFAIEDDYSAKVVVNSPGVKIKNGDIRPVTKGIPVNSGTEYTFSFYAQSSNGVELVTATPTIYWYNSAGKQISQSVGTPVETTISWAEYSVTGEAPGKDYLITDYSVTASVVTVTTSEPHSIEASAEVRILGLGVPYDGTFTVDSVTSDTLTYTISETVLTDSGTGLQAGIAVDAATYASVEIEFTTVGTVYIDLCQLAESSVTKFYEARGVQIFLGPSKSNFVNNPTYSGTTQGWGILGGTESYPAATAPYLYAGDTMLSLDCAGGAVAITDTTNVGDKPVGKFYTFSTYVQCPSGDEDVYLEFEAIDSVNPNITAVGESTLVSTEWVRISVTGYIPQDYASDTLRFNLAVKVDSASNTSVINLEAAQLEASFAASLYIDGSFPAEYGVVWEGVPYNSPSHLYKNKQQKIIRLIQELEKFLPSNTPYTVEDYGGIETAAITM